MNNDPKTSEANTSAGAGGDDEQVLQKLAIHQRRLKWLTGVAISFWALAVAGTAAVLICHALFLSPKEQQIMADYGAYGRLADRTNGAPAEASESPTRADRAMGVNFTMTYVVTRGVLLVATSVLILSGGTLATLLLVIFNRRVTLRQISYSLAQISHQLQELQAKRPA
jgi:hypothetical protein